MKTGKMGQRSLRLQWNRKLRCPICRSYVFGPVISIRRKQASDDEQLAQIDAFRVVDVEHINGRPAASGQAHEPRAFPPEMSLPALLPWIEEHNHAARHRVSAAQIAGLGQIAFMAGPRQVPGIVAAVVLLGNNVLDVKGIQWKVAFVQAAIFTALHGA